MSKFSEVAVFLSSRSPSEGHPILLSSGLRNLGGHMERNIRDQLDRLFEKNDQVEVAKFAAPNISEEGRHYKRPFSLSFQSE